MIVLNINFQIRHIDMNNKIIPTFGLALAITSLAAIAEPKDISGFLSSPPYIGVSFSMGEGYQYQAPAIWSTQPAPSYENLALLERIKSQKLNGNQTFSWTSN